jgi:uncharacterized protein (TIGR00255 family)
MIKSMTGFGSYQVENDTYRVSIEIKTLNSKFLDLTMRLPRQFSDKELEIRNLLSRKLVRGKVSFTAEFERVDNIGPTVEFDRTLFEKYYTEMSAMADAVGSGKEDIFRLAMQQPDVANVSQEVANPEDWKEFIQSCEKGVDNCDDFRVSEGENLALVLSQCIDAIQSLSVQIEEVDKTRLSNIKDRIKGNLHEVIGADMVDQNRFEQELIYYIEKIDISEELVRLDSHITFFKEVLDEKESNGKKIGFISQELGREINTIGSKSNDAQMQQLVVQMKDQLEQIKEQVLNIL